VNHGRNGGNRTNATGGMLGHSNAKGVFLARVLRNEPICRDHWQFVLALERFPPAMPGQFLQILCADPAAQQGTGGAFLRRPFSIGGLRRRGGGAEIVILHRAIGRGTQWLSHRAPGDAVSILGPLGQPFRILDDCPAALLVGGGIGLPPLIWLAESLRAAGKKTIAFCGARTADLMPLTRSGDVTVSGGESAFAFREFADVGVPVVAATDDGSLGAAGTIAEVFARYLIHQPETACSAAVYTCGPEPMIRAVARRCERDGIPCQVCLERMMACGMGTCQSCVVRVRDDQADDGWRYRLCCTDGPVFDSQTVIWDE